MSSSPTTNVSPATIAAASQEFGTVAQHMAAALARAQYACAALGNFWDPDNTGDPTAAEWYNGMWKPGWTGYSQALEACADTLNGMGGDVATTAQGYTASDNAAAENVDNLHVS